jgi:hypothetical protein
MSAPDDKKGAVAGTPRRPIHGPGVRFRDVEIWVQALKQADLAPSVRALYLRNLKAATDAAETPGVTPEDIAYWLHSLDDPALAPELRSYYQQNLRDALEEYELDSEGEESGGRHG